MGGLEATTVIRSELETPARDVPIVAMTAHALKGDRERFLEAGMSGYVSKPITAQELFAEVSRLRPDVAVAETASAEASTPPAPGGASFDEAAALSRLDGDRDLLRELAGLFAEQFPEFLTSTAAAIDAGDAAGVQRSAHTMRGSVANFGGFWIKN